MRASNQGHEAHRPHKLFGRRKGPALSAHQQRLLETLLPQLTLALERGRDPKTYFSAPVGDVWLEIGFGAGEHLLWQAAHHPDAGIIGAEPYVSGVAKLLSKIAVNDKSSERSVLSSPLSPSGGEGERVPADAGMRAGEGVRPLASTPAVNTQTSLPRHATPLPRGGRGKSMDEVVGRLRIHSNDARDILDALPDRSLGRVFILFPDPWPKTRHHKRRFIQTETLDALARAMKHGTELRFASDDADYVNWTLERVIAHRAFSWTATCARDWHTRPDDWPPTRYESKALHGVPAFLRFVRSR